MHDLDRFVSGVLNKPYGLLFKSNVVRIELGADSKLKLLYDALWTTSRETVGRGGLRFWVVDGSADHKKSVGATQRVKFLLSPDGDVAISDWLPELPE